MTLFCITESMTEEPKATRPRVCTIPGAHLEWCEYPEACRGCYPREADTGLMCKHCFKKAEDAISRAGAMVVHLRSVESGGQALGERVQSSMVVRIPVPQSWLSADELMVALGGRPIPSTASIEETASLVGEVTASWADVRARVSTEDGAAAAVRVTLLLQKALQRWPEAEAEYRAMPKPYRCLNPECGAQALYRKAPVEYLGDLTVQCEVCKTEHDWWEFVDKLGDWSAAADEDRKAKQRTERAARSREKRRLALEEELETA